MTIKFGLLRLCFQKTMSTLCFGKTTALLFALNGSKVCSISRALSAVVVIGYLVALDYIYFATYALILSGIIISVVELIANLRGKDILAKRLEVFGRVFQPLFFLTAIGIFVYLLTRSVTIRYV